MFKRNTPELKEFQTEGVSNMDWIQLLKYLVPSLFVVYMIYKERNKYQHTATSAPTQTHTGTSATTSHTNTPDATSDTNTPNTTAFAMLNTKFDRARQQLSSDIIGQKHFLDQLMIAFKRPFVSGSDEAKPKNTIIVLGGKSSGRHTCIEAVVAALKQHGVLDSGGVSRVDLSLYPTVSEKDLFLSDLYKALSSASAAVVFNHPDKCHSSAIDVLTNLAVSGIHQLQSRYAEYENALIDVTGALMGESVSEFDANGKYLVFVSDLNESKLMEVLGPRLVQAAGDILHVDRYTQDELVDLSRKFLDELKSRFSNQLSIELQYGMDFAQHCANHYSPVKGLAGILSYINENIYKPLSEYVLKKGVPAGTLVELSQSQAMLFAIFDEDRKHPVLLNDWLPNKVAERALEEVKKELDAVIGLAQVKEYVFNLEHNLKIQQMRESAGMKKATVSMHMVFTGNPGTGKTTIARIVAKYLKALGVLSIGQLREVTRSDLVGQYVGHTAKLTNEVIQSALGGVLFIDEAYALCRNKSDIFGIEAVDALVKAMEDYRDDLVVILAGYREEMEQFLQMNSGLKSRFPNVIDFPDYTAEEMVEIAVKTAGSKGYRIAEDCLEPLTRLFERSQIKGRNDSGNGRLVRNVIEAAILEQSKRLAQNPHAAALDELTAADFKFEQSDTFDLEQSLSGIVGLDSVKAFVRTQYRLLIANEKRRKAGLRTDTTQTLNMVFTGNPGTGKTTIARVIASMFKEMGVLKSGHLVETDRGGLVAEYVGHTAKKTEEVFRSALGGVLFIDEAYALADNGAGFGKEAIDTLVKLIEDYRGELAVILAGYKKEMEDFMKSNSGLQSRFPLQIDFPDYSVNELYEIALKMIDAKGFRITEEAKHKLREHMAWLHKTSTAHSGNGRMVRNEIEKIMRNQSVRIALEEVEKEDLTTILPCDVETDASPRAAAGSYDLEKALAPIVGLDEVKGFVRSLYARLRIQNERKKIGLPTDSTQTLHMIFKGNPGTGKTMMARIIADVLYHIGVIRTNKLVETDRAGLVAGYVGQTAIKTTEKVQEALGGVLFIDEAYALSQGGPHDFGKEAIDTLVKLMDDHRERLVVILAGYSRDMDGFLQTNPGLKSRFPNIIEFPDYSLDELMRIAEALYSQKGYVLSEEARKKLSAILDEARREEAFGNGRYVRNVFERSVNRQALRLSTDPDLTKDELMTIEADDIERL
jgi:SpoVK/Ycf46/Vps4 family AAA+-type ATPase